MLRTEDLLIISLNTIRTKNSDDKRQLIEYLESLNIPHSTPEHLSFIQELLKNAIVLNKEKILTLVFDRGLSVNGLVNTYHLPTPLCIAAATNETVVLTYLIKRSALVDQPQHHGGRTTGYTPLHSAASYGALEAATLLLDAGALVDPPLLNLENCDPYGTFNATPLHFACDAGYENIVDLLIKRDANINAIDRNGRTPLHYAAATGSVSIVEKLLAAGADPFVKDLYGESPLSAAITQYHEVDNTNPSLNVNHLAVIQHLLKIGVQVSDNDVAVARKQKKAHLADDIYADDIYSLVSANNKKSMSYASSPILLHANKRIRTPLSSNIEVKPSDNAWENITSPTVLRPAK